MVSNGPCLTFASEAGGELTVTVGEGHSGHPFLLPLFLRVSSTPPGVSCRPHRLLLPPLQSGRLASPAARPPLPVLMEAVLLQVAKEGYNIKMGRRKRFTVGDSKEDREDSLKKKTGPSCDTDAKKAKKKTMKEVYDGEPEMLDTLIFQEHVENHWQLVVICNKQDNDMLFLMLLDSLHMGEPTRIEDELKK
ncbi:hypothetical protein Taro_039803 [Colocasia esculenta]|uniref:Uncharacterized protein n=1 Tax=Colocasia esculenta TaxID=4460 RepID=A0A843WNB2_COLES|nr:hypothetical protein [Colocasia esculenta]